MKRIMQKKKLKQNNIEAFKIQFLVFHSKIYPRMTHIHKQECNAQAKTKKHKRNADQQIE